MPNLLGRGGIPVHILVCAFVHSRVCMRCYVITYPSCIYGCARGAMLKVMLEHDPSPFTSVCASGWLSFGDLE
jgi:hypothetical protein